MRKMLSGVMHFDPAKVFPGYTLWSPIDAPADGADTPGQYPGFVRLMDMRGRTVHEWNLPFPTFYAYLLPDGHLLAGLRTTETDGTRPGVAPFNMGGTQGYLCEYDWDGNLVFQHKDLTMHHDFKKLPNGNYMYLAWEQVPPEMCAKIRGGMKGTEAPGGVIWGDVIKEVDPQGRVVWFWRATDHMDFDVDIIGPVHTRDEWSHLNTLWVTEEDDIMSSSRHIDMAFKISRKTGDIVWRWGNAAYLDKESGTLELRCNDTTLGGQHDVHVIPSGLPGAGHMLCYDNGMYKYMSRAVEVDMATNEIVWESKAPNEGYMNGRVPFSTFISGARRLPNGNTLLCEGQNGRFYEITPDREVVWEYYRENSDLSATRWAVFRAFRYAPDFCPQFASLPGPM